MSSFIHRATSKIIKVTQQDRGKFLPPPMHASFVKLSSSKFVPITTLYMFQNVRCYDNQRQPSVVLTYYTSMSMLHDIMFTIIYEQRIMNTVIKPDRSIIKSMTVELKGSY